MMSLSFHPIKPDDIEQLMPIENACHSHPWNEKLFKSCLGDHYFAEYLMQEGEENKIIGFYVAQAVAGEATLMDICVSPIEQGKGYGKALLIQFIAQAKALNNTTLFLEVRVKNISAQMLYINNGFTEIGRRTGYYPSANGFGYEDAIIMKKNIA